MTDSKTRATKPDRKAMFQALVVGILPYLAGLIVLVTRDLIWLVIAGVMVVVCSTIGAYFLRRSGDPVLAKQRLIIDPLLYVFEFTFTAVLIRYFFVK